MLARSCSSKLTSPRLRRLRLTSPSSLLLFLCTSPRHTNSFNSLSSLGRTSARGGETSKNSMGKRNRSSPTEGARLPSSPTPPLREKEKEKEKERRKSTRRKAPVSYVDDGGASLETHVLNDQNDNKVSTKKTVVFYSPPESPGLSGARHDLSALKQRDDSGAKRDTNGCLVFKDVPEFRPNLTPQQMIQAGIFGGCYFNPSGGKKGVKYPKGGIPIDYKEYPAVWFESVPEYKYYSKRYNCETNFYRVKAGQDQTFWEEKGWINPQDPRGWFQWYTRFFLGRRTEDDARQISRWKGVTGSKGRWKRFLLNKIVAANAHLDDYSVSPVVRQTLLHWAYEVTPKDMKVHLSRMK
mmetsp:Transcript_11542/g.21646  ORF Transcript_11542/g.21646 Transcript_11542/m.21646 type:complete len:353 (+) Transcript_11542:43-1101(+)